MEYKTLIVLRLLSKNQITYAEAIELLGQGTVPIKPISPAPFTPELPNGPQPATSPSLTPPWKTYEERGRPWWEVTYGPILGDILPNRTSFTQYFEVMPKSKTVVN